MHRLTAAVAALLAVLSMLPVRAAAEWPDKPVRVIVPYVAGGANDLLGRVFAEQLSKTFGQQFFVENRTGGGGLIGTDAVARAAPDGYTLITSGMPSHVLAPAMNKNCELRPGQGLHPHRLSRRAAQRVRGASVGGREQLQGTAGADEEPAGRRAIRLAEHRLGRQHGGGVRRRQGEGEARPHRLSRRRLGDPGSGRGACEGRQHDAVDHAAAHPGRQAQAAGDLVRETRCRNFPTCRRWSSSAIRN